MKLAFSFQSMETSKSGRW